MKTVAVTFVLCSAATVLAAPAALARDAYPCGPRVALAGVGYVQYCPDWSPNNWIPVHRYARVSSVVVGSIYAPGNDWYMCQGRVPGGVYALGSYQTDVWATTMADNGQWGYVPEVYFRGGSNFEADATLAGFCEWF